MNNKSLSCKSARVTSFESKFFGKVGEVLSVGEGIVGLKFVGSKTPVLFLLSEVKFVVESSFDIAQATLEFGEARRARLANQDLSPTEPGRSGFAEDSAAAAAPIEDLRALSSSVMEEK